MKAPALGEAAVDLPWLSPSVASLAALARGPLTAVWPEVRFDPGCVLLLARRWEGMRTAHAPSFLSPGNDSALFETALLLLDGPTPAFVDWSQPDLRPLYVTCLRQAQLAQQLAGHIEHISPEQAWVGGLLAPLGWLAASAVQPALVRQCLQDARFPHRANTVQRECWGLDQGAIARRLCRRWGLPEWMTNLLGHLGLPVGIALNLGIEPRLFQVVQLAILLIQQNTGGGLGLAIGGAVDELVSALRLTAEQVEPLLQSTLTTPLPVLQWEAPGQNRLLSDFLRLALASRRQNDPVLIERLHAEVDSLQRALEAQCASEQERLGTLKLNALAELAAGASHEINNPLAVISGQAQYALRQLQLAQIQAGNPITNGESSDPFPGNLQQSLHTIIKQTQRIHQILNELMQFARPPRPNQQEIAVSDLLQAVAGSLQDLAQQHRVRLIVEDPPGDSRLQGDPSQIHTALTCLLRNAIEAAPADGWTRLRVQKSSDNNWDLVVEDSGPGPTAQAQEHLFDPFFSGRSAGRGRGLGLPTAWRLAQQQGGKVWFDGRPQDLTRFVLRLPAAQPAPSSDADNNQNGSNGYSWPAPVSY